MPQMLNMMNPRNLCGEKGRFLDACFWDKNEEVLASIATRKTLGLPCVPSRIDRGWL